MPTPIPEPTQAPAEPSVPEEPEEPHPIAVRVCAYADGTPCGYILEIYTYGLSDDEYDAWDAHCREHEARGESNRWRDQEWRPDLEY